MEGGNHAQNILIPLEVDHSSLSLVTLFWTRVDSPQKGKVLCSIMPAAVSGRVTASLTIHRELGDPTLEDGYTITLLKVGLFH